jgi:hypothetical protein
MTGTPQQIPQLVVGGYMPYAALGTETKQSIDRIYDAIMQHKTSMASVAKMAPKLLNSHPQQADIAAGEDVPLSQTVKKLAHDAQDLEYKLKDLREKMTAIKDRHEKMCIQSLQYARWPTEVVASRLGVKLAPSTENSTDEAKRKEIEFNNQLQRLLDNTLIQTDQVEKMPSPYFWDLLHELESRAVDLMGRLHSLKQDIEATKSVSLKSISVAQVIELHDGRIWRIADDIGLVHLKVEQMRHLYNLFERGPNILEEDHQRELAFKRSVDREINMMNILHLKESAPTPAPATGGLFGSSASAPSGGLFGGMPSHGTGFSPAPSGSLFGNSAPTPASGSSLFGTTSIFGGGSPSAAPSSGLFGTPSTGTLFGGTGNKPPAPAFAAVPEASTLAPTLSFGQTSTAALGAPTLPAFGGTSTTSTSTPLFSGTSSTPKAKNKSRVGTRRR